MIIDLEKTFAKDDSGDFYPLSRTAVRRADERKTWTEVRGAVEAVMSEYLAVFLEEHPKDGQAILEKWLNGHGLPAAARDRFFARAS